MADDPLPGVDDSNYLTGGFAASSAFGTNYDGSVDTQDNGVGKWGANTRDPSLKGVALPTATVRQYIGDPDDPETRKAINSGKYQVEVTTASGRTGLYPVVDMGPAPWTGKGIDLTGGAARDLGLNQNSYVHYQLRKKDDSAAQQTQEESSPLAQLREKYPQYANITDEKLIDTIYGTSPKFKTIDQKQFASWMKSPTGGKAIQDAVSKGETPIQKFRDRYPQYGTLTDDQIAIKLLPIVQKKEPQVTLEGLKERLNPPKDNAAAQWAKTIGETAIETVRQIPAQSADVVGSAWRGVSEISNKGAQDEVNKLLPDLGQGMSVEDWLKLTPDQREAKLYSGTSLLGPKKADPRSQDFLIALGVMDKNGEVQKANQWMNKVVGQIDQDNKGSLPANQEQVAKTIAQAPAVTLLNLFPGMRELANYGMLYDQNRRYLESKNPSLGTDKINQMAMQMADQQFPAQETLGLIMARGGGALTAGITNKILKAGAEVTLAGGTGAGVFTSNQLIRNIGSGDDWTKDLGESAFEGSLLGGVGAGTRLTLNGIKTLLSTSPEGKAASGTLQAVTELEPKEANDFVAGGSNNGVGERINGTAIDLGLDAIKSQPLVDTVRNAVAQAEVARANGDNQTAAQKFDQGLSLMDDASRQKVADIVQQSVKAIAQKDPTSSQTKITGWQELKPWQTQADVPEDAQVKIDPSGKTFWKATPDKTQEVKQPDLTGFYGLDKAPGEESEMMSGANPFAAARALQSDLDKIAFFKNWNKVFAPERLGEQASDTAALGKGITATEKTASTMAMRVLADESSLNSVIKNGVDSSRRESYWHKYSKQELADIISKREKGEKTGNPINDQMFDYYRKGYDYFGNRAKANGIKLGWVEDYYRHSFKDSKAAQAFFQGRQKMWGDPSFTKTRSFPTINDAIAAGLEPKTYNPERNFLAYVASVNNAVRKVQHLRQMEQNGLAYQDGKNVPEIAKEWEKISTPDGKEYRVHPDSAAVLANMYNISSVYDTIAGPFVSFAGAVKGVSGIKLSWSGFHPLHIIGVDVAQSFTNLEHRLIKGKVTGKDFLDALASPTRPFTAPFSYGRLRDVMTGKAGKAVLENLTDQEKTDLRDLGEMGIVSHVSHERQMEWTQWLTRQANKLGPVSKAVGLGYKILIAEPYQKIMFQHMIPALKISQALARRDTLLRLHPDLYEPQNRMLRAREFQKINRDIEGRFGEMFYDNLLWNSMAKQVGVSVPLSLGWTLGFWRIYGDAATDLTNNAIHMDQIGKEATKNREWVTERMLYAANYSALAAVSCGLLTYAATGAIKSWMDYFYPRIGKKPNGDDERVRTPFFTTEWASMYQHYATNAQKGGDPVHGVIGGGTEYLMNKLNPGLQSIYEYWNNKDFRGREIHDPTDPWPTQLADTTAFFIQNMGLPISAENVVAQKGQMTPEGTVASFFGLSSAPGWTGRTWLENSILTEYGREHGTEAGKSKRAGELTDAKKEYEESLKTGQGVMEARLKLKALGVSDRVIHESDKNYRIPIANRLFKLLDAGVQVKMLKEMNPSERAEFLPYASKKARAQYVAGQVSQ